MNINTAGDPRPAQAVGYPAQSRGSDGYGGGTAGTPPVGEGAAGAHHDHQCETPLLSESQRSSEGTNRDPFFSPSARLGSSPAPSGGMENLPQGAGPMPKPPPIKLRDRSFKIGTWNMCGRFNRSGSSLRPKMPFAEDLLALEDIDILVLTETHSLLPPRVSLATHILGHSGLSDASAGITVISRSARNWSCLHSGELVPGHALLLHLRHGPSTEKFWLLCVYGDISRTSGVSLSLKEFYSTLRARLLDFIETRNVWNGCLAAVDWNFVSHPEDRFPVDSFDSTRMDTAQIFSDIESACLFRDAAGPHPFPSGWTYRGDPHGRTSYSRLDRIYYPTSVWSSANPLCFDTNWSDHKVVTATLTVLSPAVQSAIPAPRLPDVRVLNKDRSFWPQILSHWRILCSSDITLESWTLFKTAVLHKGAAANRREKSSWSIPWKEALRGECLSPDELEAARRGMYAPPRPPRPGRSRWAPTVPSAVIPPLYAKPRRPWAHEPSSPWCPPLLIN